MAADPALSSLWNGRLGAVMDTVRDGSSYLGDEIDIAGGKAPVGVAEAKRPGFEEFVRQKKIPLFVEDRGGLVLFSPERAAVEEEARNLFRLRADAVPTAIKLISAAFTAEGRSVAEASLPSPLFLSTSSLRPGS